MPGSVEMFFKLWWHSYCFLTCPCAIEHAHNNNNNNRRLVTLAEHTSDHGRQTNSSTEENAHAPTNLDFSLDLLYLGLLFGVSDLLLVLLLLSLSLRSLSLRSLRSLRHARPKACTASKWPSVSVARS